MVVCSVKEEIIVTARQSAESLFEVPASITVITSSQMEGAGVQRAEDFIAKADGALYEAKRNRRNAVYKVENQKIVVKTAKENDISLSNKEAIIKMIINFAKFKYFIFSYLLFKVALNI